MIIDTPGFGDTEGRDEEFSRNLNEFFTTTNLTIKAICFCMKASDNRCGVALKMVIESVLQFFGKDCFKNIIGMCTFASANDPECLAVLQKEDIKNYFKFDNQAIFPKDSHSLKDT